MAVVATPPRTLVERLRAIYTTETGFGDPLNEAVWKMPTDTLGHAPVKEIERDFGDWGAMVGLAYGIARMEDPCEGLQSVADRALTAARVVRAEYASELFEGLLERGDA